MEKFLRILFIEDSEDDVFLITTHIQNSGYTVSGTRVDNDHDYLVALQQGYYWDVILSDYALPGFSGRRALDLFRKTELKIPFILISGALGEDIAVLMLKSGASDFVLKNNLRRLVPAIERGVEESKQRRERQASEQPITPAEGILLRSPVVVYQGSLELREHPKFISDNFRIFGFNMDEFQNEQVLFSDIIYPDDLNRITAEILNYDKLKVDNYTLQYRIINPKQEITWVKDYITVIRNEKGEVTNREGTLIGITDLEVTPEKQQENFEIYRSLFQDNIELLLVIAPETLTIIDANRAACIFYGYTHDEILKKKIYDLSIGNKAELYSEFTKSLHSNNYRTYDKHKLSNGQIRTLEIHAGQVNLGGKAYIRAVLFDITNQDAQEKKPGGIDKYLDLLDILPHCTMITDMKHNILHANAECVKLLGYSSIKELVNKSGMELFSPEYIQMFADQQIVDTLINTGQIQSMKVRLINKNGTIFWNSMDCRLIKDTDGKPDGILSVFSDTSKQDKAFQDVEESEQRFLLNFENAPIGKAMVTMDNSFLKVNQAFIRMLLWVNRDYSQYTMLDLFNTEDIQFYISSTKQLTDKSTDHVSWKSMIKIDDNQTMPVQISATLISFESIPQYFLIQMEEITQSKQQL